MARFSKDEVIGKLGSTRFLPLFNVADAELCREVVHAAYRAGMRAFELTNRDASALAVFRQLLPFVAEHCPDLALGAGTILDEGAAAAFMDAGADFIVAPVFDQATAHICGIRGLPYIPGCLTPTEMYEAYREGSAVVKLFPGSAVGPGYLKQVLAPLPFLKILVTGGVSFDQPSVKSWFDHGAFALGIGSSVFTRDRIHARDIGSIEADLERIIRF